MSSKYAKARTIQADVRDREVFRRSSKDRNEKEGFSFLIRPPCMLQARHTGPRAKLRSPAHGVAYIAYFERTRLQNCKKLPEKEDR